MATYFAFGYADDRQPAMKARPTSEALTATGTAASTSASAPGNGMPFVRVTTEEKIYVAFGPNVTATATNGFAMLAGQSEYFPLNGGDKASVILA